MVDDEEFCLTTIRVLLRKAKVTLSHVDFCIDGLEALNKVKEVYEKGEKYDIIMTDFNMPKLSGIESTQKIRDHLTEKLKIERQNQPKIFGITAHFHKHYIEQGKKAGIDNIYAKPITFEVLVQILEQ